MISHHVYLITKSQIMQAHLYNTKKGRLPRNARQPPYACFSSLGCIFFVILDAIAFVIAVAEVVIKQFVVAASAETAVLTAENVNSEEGRSNSECYADGNGNDLSYVRLCGLLFNKKHIIYLLNLLF